MRVGSSVRNDREEVIAGFLPLVRHVAYKLQKKLALEVDAWDLIDSGVIGLIEALEEYNPKWEVPFGIYAQRRVSNTILEMLRTNNLLPATHGKSKESIEFVSTKLEKELRRPAESCELAERIGVDMKEFYVLLQRIAEVPVLSLDELMDNYHEDRTSEKEDIAEPAARLGHSGDRIAIGEDPLHADIDNDGPVAEAISRLPELERQVISLHYYEHLPLRDVGTTLGLSERKVINIHKRAIGHLRKRMS